MPRFFANAFDIKEDGIVLTGENMHHLIKVLRHKKGDEIIVCDGAGFDYLCVISDIKEDKVNLKILDKYGSLGDPEIKISLFQGVPKGDKFSLIVEKCVEAGVYDITPVNMARCISRLSPKDFSKKKERFEKISLSASKQSGRGTVPNINELIEFDEFIDRKDKFDLVVFPYEEAKDKTLKSVIKDFKGKKIAMIIGPEGGFSKEEVQKLVLNGITPVTLGRRILRTETAGMAAIFNILYELEL